MKIVKLGIKRDNDMMYYIKTGDVWATPRRKPGQPKGKASKIATAGIEMDYSKYLYYLDGDGDIARKERQVGGNVPRTTVRVASKAKKAPSKVKPKPAKKSAKKYAKGMGVYLSGRGGFGSAR